VRISLREKFKQNEVLGTLKVLSKLDRRKISYVAFLQLTLSVLDLVGVAIIGILGALAISGVESRNPGNRVSAALKLIHLNKVSFQTTAAVLGLTAGVLLISRTLASAYLTRRTLFFLSRRGTEISITLVNKILSQPLLLIQSRTSQETLYALTSGVEAIVLRIIGALISIISDTTLLIVMAIGLFVVDPTMAFSTFTVFSLIGYLLYLTLHKHAISLGRRNAELVVKNNEKILEILKSYREATVRGTKAYYSAEIGKLRLGVNNTSAEIAFLPNVSKYIVETTVVLGSLIIAGAQFIMKDAVHAVATLSVFIAAGTRIGPASLRLQQGAIQIKTNMGMANTTLALITQLENSSSIRKEIYPLDLKHHGFKSDISITDLILTYPTRSKPALNGVNLQIKEGQFVALVGPSGAGKTSLIDSMMGVLEPSSGEIMISGMTPNEAIIKWPGSIGYVPQDVSIFTGSVKSNVSLGFSEEEARSEQVEKALGTAMLLEFIQGLEDGLETSVGEGGTSLSGGQRQRLGIARAMFTDPKLLVLDEATSALDGETEMEVSNAIRKLRGNTTIIMIAHRLSTVRDADMVVYMESGKVVSTGSFEEVRSQVPDFDKQASLMGL
jgi:ABC-type multidrug transport system fused ATPase/permease subunit